eukprot:Seg5686.1 transcript_id=Seg5686.1/GoldUCD/mRNA.D3Y31 product="hypothetical protein" protein_id=Seg5686.1/GoldUCD/D3Y31
MSSFKPLPGQHVILPMLGKIRAAFAIAGPLSIAGKSQSSIKVYMRIVKELLSEDKRKYFSDSKLNSLEDKVEETKECDDADENARLIRSGLEDIYDDLIDHYCGLNGVTFDPAHQKISRAIELCRPLVRSGRYTDSIRIYKKIAEDLLTSCKTITEKALNRLQDALQFSFDCKDLQECNLKLRKSLDYVYDEIRLPEIYTGITVSVESQPSSYVGKKVLLFGYADFGKELEHDVIYLDDGIIDGKSRGEFIPRKPGENYGIFEGTVKVSPEGGFASVRFLPKDGDALKESLQGCKGLLLSLKNMKKQSIRPKLLLSSEKNSHAFNWQCGLNLPHQEEFTEIYLPLQGFWPTMFGHVLATNGNVQVDKVDSIGIMLSKLTEDGKLEPDFREGDFCVGIQWICAVKDNDE